MRLIFLHRLIPPCLLFSVNKIKMKLMSGVFFLPRSLPSSSQHRGKKSEVYVLGRERKKKVVQEWGWVGRTNGERVAKWKSEIRDRARWCERLRALQLITFFLLFFSRKKAMREGEQRNLLKWSASSNQVKNPSACESFRSRSKVPW